MKTDKKLLLIFTRNPELGKVKTRLAATIGDSAALEIYKDLIQQTVNASKDLKYDKEVHYAEELKNNDAWDNEIFIKKSQSGLDLGSRMENAFKQGFQNSYEQIIIIGSDLPEISEQILTDAFSALNKHDFVIGPASDGGYYLLGMKSLHPEIFKNKVWSTDSVFKNTLENIKTESVKILETRNDIDTYKDLAEFEKYQEYLK